MVPHPLHRLDQFLASVEVCIEEFRELGGLRVWDVLLRSASSTRHVGPICDGRTSCRRGWRSRWTEYGMVGCRGDRGREERDRGGIGQDGMER